MKKKKNMPIEKEKSLLVIIGGAVSQRYYRYKVLIIEKFKPEIIKPYVLLFPYKLNRDEIEYINSLLTNKTKYKWFTIKSLRERLPEN